VQNRKAYCAETVVIIIVARVCEIEWKCTTKKFQTVGMAYFDGSV